MAKTRRAQLRSPPDEGVHEEEQHLRKPRKRVETPTVDQPAPKRQKQHSGQAQKTDTIALANASSPFFELPAELRNEVYEYVALSAGAQLRPRFRGRLISATALCRVSKQVRKEYEAALYVSASRITAHVRNFDFGHLVTYLNKLTGRELSALPMLNIPSQRTLEVHVYITQSCSTNPEGLRKWLRRCLHSTKKGTKMDVQYTITAEPPDPSEELWEYSDMDDGPAKYVRTWLEDKMDDMTGYPGRGGLLRFEGGEEDSRLFLEMRKIRLAFPRNFGS
ncbi:hypothetical protein LTR08_006499 [Meristemomyces frigidus]|nr:hypothetical protein LTR08_006499 [Meristemomyces frigidus]